MPHHFGWSCHLTWYIMEKGMDPTHACMACPKHLQPSHNCTDGRSSLLFFTVAFSEVSRHVVSQNNPSAVGVHFKNLMLKDFFFFVLEYLHQGFMPGMDLSKTIISFSKGF